MSSTITVPGGGHGTTRPWAAALLLGLALALTACLASPGDACGDRALCAEGTTCDAVLKQCVTPGQRTACAGRPDGDACSYRGQADGLCRAETCLRAGCGDGFVRGTEQCDGDDLGAASDCASVGWYGAGRVHCRVDCIFDLSECTGSCGDRVAQPGQEPCDGNDLAGQSCGSLGFHGGALACQPNCQLDLSQCLGRCGDGTRTAGEMCDGNDFGGDGCADLGFHTGRLACSDDCQRIDTSACTGTCGDGVRNGPEVCDGPDTARASCQSLGWNGGVLGCRADCGGYDTGDCAGYCGDGVANGNELCDGLDQRGASCTSFGARGGGLGCDAACRPTFERCHWGQWRPVPVDFDLAYLGGTGPDDVWAVSNTRVFRYDGMRWRDVPPPGGGDLLFRAVAGTGPDDVWIGGEALFHLAGDGWQPVADVEHVTSIWTAARDDVWVSTYHAIHHYDGDHWTHVEIPVGVDAVGNPETIDSVWSPGYGDAWATTSLDRTLRLAGDTWSTVRDHGEAIWGTSSHDLWVAGGRGIEHFDGRDWTLEFATDVISQPTIWGSGHDDVWVSGGFDALLHYDGVTWRNAQLVGETVSGGWAAAPGDLWASTSSVHHHDGPGWINHPFEGVINGIWSHRRDDVWTVGAHGVIRHFDGLRWTETSAGDRTLLGVWSSAADDVWVVGRGGTILHFDGAAWTEVPSGTTNTLLEVYGTSARDVWAVGLGGVILHFDGDTWRRTGPDFPPDPEPHSDYTFDLRRVWASDPDNVWIMANMHLVHFDGVAWTILDLDTWFADLWGTGRDDLWIATEYGVLHDDGTGLHEVFHDDHHSMYAVGGSGPLDVWLFGEDGTVHHYDGTGWNPVAIPVSHDVTKVRASGAGDVWGINFNGDPLMHLGHPLPVLHAGACRAPIPLACQSKASGATYGAAATFTHYAGAARDDAGGEVVYRLESPITGKVTVALAARHADLDLIALGHGDTGCLAGTALAASQRDGVLDEAIELEVNAGDVRYIVVDAPGGPGAYGLEVTCTRR